MYFEEVKKNFGFGCMRLPLAGDKIDYKELNAMVDKFLEEGFNYFDTAHGYHDGLSEIAVRECLVKRHDRSEFLLTDKLTEPYFNSEEEIRPFFESQLVACGVNYFDFYLMHAQNASNFEKFKRCRAYETAFALKAEGKIKHVGLSFHDKAEVLDRILTEYPQVEAVQIQFNYADFDDAGIQSKLCYDVCRKHNKPIIVMEPVKGGTLANLPEAAQAVIEKLGSGSAASIAIRYAAGFDGIFMVLSGMSNLAQVEENCGFMRDFKKLDTRELAAVKEINGVFRNMDLIACTACRYCTAGCPKKISIPDLFADMNAKHIHKDWNSDFYYGTHTANAGKASDCIGCGKCEKSCPQHLNIRDLLKDVAKQFEI